MAYAERHNDFYIAQDLLSLLHIASKYEMETLRAHFKQRVLAEWPLTLDEWDTSFLSNVPNCLSPEKVSQLTGIARECDVAQILPAIFYYAARSLFTALRVAQSPQTGRTTVPAAWLAALSPPISAHILLGHQAMSESLCTLMEDMLQVPLWCELCREARELVILRIEPTSGDPLLCLQNLIKDVEEMKKNMNPNPCGHPLPFAHCPDIAAYRREMWENLTDYLHLQELPNS